MMESRLGFLKTKSLAATNSIFNPPPPMFAVARGFGHVRLDFRPDFHPPVHFLNWERRRAFIAASGTAVAGFFRCAARRFSTSAASADDKAGSSKAQRAPNEQLPLAQGERGQLLQDFGETHGANLTPPVRRSKDKTGRSQAWSAIIAGKS